MWALYFVDVGFKSALVLICKVLLTIERMMFYRLEKPRKSDHSKKHFALWLSFLDPFFVDGHRSDDKGTHHPVD